MHAFMALHTTTHRQEPYKKQFCTQWVRTAKPHISEILKDIPTGRVRLNSHFIVVVFISTSLSFFVQLILTKTPAQWAVSQNLVVM